MRRNGKTKAALLFSLLFAVVVSFTAFTAIVSAESSDNKPPVDKKEIFKDVTESGKTLESGDDPDVNGVHADPAVFEKNFCLSVAEKEETITEIEKVVSYYINKKMSDLEKYYTLAKWTNQRVVYDNDFWPAGYNLDYYSHQWDAYGAINEDEKSVCAGIAVFYSNMCHAAGLPCYFVRLDPNVLDHTITYIPDINRHAYYADITENDFLMSKEACWFAENADLGFSGITQENADDGSFEYHDEYGMLQGADIKECWQDKISYKKWFKEYALHEGTDKDFRTPYPEDAPSSKDGVPYASYADFDKYPPQPYEDLRTYNDVTGIWFLDDFYMNPAEAKFMIEGRVLNEQFLNISGVKGNYDCGSTGDLVEAVSDDISIKYFPSVNEKGEVVAKAAELKKDADNADYSVTFVEHDDETGEEVLKIQGEGRYRGSCELRVRMNSAIAKTPPARINGLVYNGKSQKLIEPGEAENGTMLYAVCDPETTPADGDYKVDIPEGTNAGKYDIWYKVIGDETHSDMPAQKLIIPNLASAHIKDRPVRIVPRDIEESGKIKLSKTAFTYNGKVQKPSIKATGLKEGTDYIVVKWDNSSSKNVDTYGVNITGTGNYDGDFWLSYTINKAANPMKLKAKTAKVKRSKVKKKARTIKRAKVVTVSKAQGKLSYKLVSAKKGKKSFKKKFSINVKTGNVTVKKGTKKGTYKVKVKVKAAGNASYKASKWKNVTFTVKVK